jgi:capsular exopolysaccharide synthesis family protein
MSEDGRGPVEVNRTEFDFSYAHGRLLFSSWTERGSRVWRINEWSLSGDKLVLQASRRLGAECTTIELVPRASAKALVAGIAVIFLFVFLDRSIKRVSDATQAASAPVLGVIPQVTSADLGVTNDDRARDMYVYENPKSSIAECCRSLRTNLLFSAADRELKTIAVCSANQREGKTTTVIYLGTTMAQGGQRTLLIDSDMRRPRLHKSTGVALAPGLSNLLIGEDDYDNLIKPTDVKDMFVLPCGPTPPNPAELLLTKRFETVLGELARRFDRIILDSPPIQPVTDAVVLSKRVDGVVLVVRASKTLRDELRRSARMIRDVGGTIVGVIVNELDARDSHYYGYGGYGYGSYYGYDSRPDKVDPAA